MVQCLNHFSLSILIFWHTGCSVSVLNNVVDVMETILTVYNPDFWDTLHMVTCSYDSFAFLGKVALIRQITQSCVVCSVSKQHAVIPSQVFELEDGSSSYKDFAMTRNNRFTSAGQASKNIIQPPSAVLHYYNVPPCISQDHLLRVRHDSLMNILKF